MDYLILHSIKFKEKKISEICKMLSNKNLEAETDLKTDFLKQAL